MGHADSVSRLLQLVESETAQKNAAQALHLITGAGLYQDAGPGNEADPGKLSVDPEEWRFWWKANQYRFDTTVRYRYGRPYAPDQLVEGLEHKDSPFFVRKMAYEELVVRFGLVVPFETDLFVSQ